MKTFQQIWHESRFIVISFVCSLVTSNEQQNKAQQEERSDDCCRLLKGVCRTETVVRGQVQLLAFRVAVVSGFDVALAPNSQSLQFFILFLLFLFLVVRNDHVS